MMFRPHRWMALGALVALGSGLDAASAAAWLYWEKPDFSGAPVTGDEPGIILPLPGATQKEVQASLLWAMRAGLNVAALQCGFSPALMTRINYNAILKHHAVELNNAYQTLGGYFKRTARSNWAKSFDQYTTRTYNGFSTMYAQTGFCDTAASISREAIARPKGSLHLTATARMQEFRNSLVPASDKLFTQRRYLLARTLPPLDQSKCWDRRNNFRDNKCAIPGTSFAQR